MTIASNTVQQLESLQGSIAKAVVEQTYRLDPSLTGRYGEAGRAKCLQDTIYHIQYLTQALRYSSPRLFTEYVNWLAYLLNSLNIPLPDLQTNLVALKAVLQEQLPDLEEVIFTDYLLPATDISSKPPEEIHSFIKDEQPLASLCQNYLATLLKGDQKQARLMVLEAIEQGTPVRDIYLHVFQNSQREIGRLWQQRKISVGQEHFCTAATQSIMSQLYPYVLSDVQRVGKRLVAVCVGNELHEIGLRMLSDFFEMDGWDTYYLGANVPLDSVLKAISEPRADLLAISTTMTIHLPASQTLIDRVRNDKLALKTKILVGGYSFNIDSDLWQKMGADGYAADSAAAITEARRLVQLPVT